MKPASASAPADSLWGEELRTPAAANIAQADRLRWLLLGCVVCLYLPLIFAGPGSDPDSLRELDSGATLLRQHLYVSRVRLATFPTKRYAAFSTRSAGPRSTISRRWRCRWSRSIHSCTFASTSKYRIDTSSPPRWRFIRCTGPPPPAPSILSGRSEASCVGFRLWLGSDISPPLRCSGLRWDSAVVGIPRGAISGLGDSSNGRASQTLDSGRIRDRNGRDALPPGICRIRKLT